MGTRSIRTITEKRKTETMIKHRKIPIVRGDILDAKEYIIVQNVNAQGVMGAGLALSLRNKYPEMFESYRRHCNTPNRNELLGTVHKYFVISENINKPDKVIMNIVGQLRYGRGSLQLDYTAFERGVVEVASFARRMYKTTAISYRIGCGLAGGDWSKVSAILNRHFIADYTRYYKN